MTDTEWQQVIASVLQGDREAFSQVVRGYQKPIYYYCYHMLQHAAEAEDCAQETFLKLYRSLEKYNNRQSAEAWLYKIAYHQCIDLLRKRKLARYLPFFYQRDKDHRHVDQQIDATYFDEEVHRAMSKLTGEERNLLILRCVEDMSYDKMAVILQTRPATLRKRYERTAAKFRNYFREVKGENSYDHRAKGSGAEAALAKKAAT
ncbi:RNA polymerase sigma factor [Paenibacillus sp. SYP-B4298]|uniref:RNA polymerase sigma factor n=1 Tax=Paenibacillus sp. SYP-B4298 TaxID=2996034 RepID=UPI0022DE9156|nr:sigma-70 family RNA polymerase sigma factor [Paenibacillus sp. SYP-B4298]